MTRVQQRVLLVAGVLSFSVLTVYTQYVFLHTTDHVTNRPFRDLSLDQYHEILDGRRPFPYQWRVAGPRLVRTGALLTGRDPHHVDVVLKVTALMISALLLLRFTARWTTRLGSVAAVALYFVLTAAAYAPEGYSIYYTNDYLAVMGWYAAVCLAAERRFGWLAAVVFATAWAKETIVLAPVLVTLAWWRGRATRGEWLLCAIAFLIPTAFLRLYYPARLAYWAWWGNVTLNIPFLRPQPRFVLAAMRDNLKLLISFNVLWILAYQTFKRTSHRDLRDLVYVGVLYLGLMYNVVMIRELRHFLPLAIIILPLSVMALEEGSPPVRCCGA
jgi:hypothetical protein